MSVSKTVLKRKALKEAFAIFSSKVRFMPEVSTSRYRLFQVADVVCTLELVKLRQRIGALALTS